MVAPLKHICLLQVRNNVLDGLGLNLNQLPVHIRQTIFETTVSSGLASEPNFQRCFRHRLFFRDFKTIDLTGPDRANSYDNAQPADKSRLLTNILLRTFRKFPAIASSVECLKVRLCNKRDRRVTVRKSDACAATSSLNMLKALFSQRTSTDEAVDDSAPIVSTCDLVRELIDYCDNLKQLHVIGGANCDRCLSGKSGTDQWPVRGKKKRVGNGPPTETTLEVVSYQQKPVDRSIANVSSMFRSLTNLKWRNCSSGYGDLYRQLLNVNRNTLKCLIVETVGSDIRELLPLALPNLRNFVVQMEDDEGLGREFVENLRQCPSLERLSLQINTKTDSSLVHELMQIQRWPSLEIVLNFRHPTVQQELLEILGPKIVGVRLSLSSCLIKEETVDKVLDNCPNLRRLDVWNSCFSDNRLLIDRCLRRFLGESSRAAKLQSFTSLGYVSSTTVDLLFRNCIGLEKLCVLNVSHIQSGQVKDANLIEWIDNGAKPSALSIRNTEGITERGFAYLFRSCSETLRDVSITQKASGLTTDAAKVLFQNCPFLERAKLRVNPEPNQAFVVSDAPRSTLAYIQSLTYD